MSGLGPAGAFPLQAGSGSPVCPTHPPSPALGDSHSPHLSLFAQELLRHLREYVLHWPLCLTGQGSALPGSVPAFLVQ